MEMSFINNPIGFARYTADAMSLLIFQLVTTFDGRCSVGLLNIPIGTLHDFRGKLRERLELECDLMSDRANSFRSFRASHFSSSSRKIQESLRARFIHFLVITSSLMNIYVNNFHVHPLPGRES